MTVANLKNVANSRNQYEQQNKGAAHRPIGK
jgi:hypothetical protein